MNKKNILEEEVGYKTLQLLVNSNKPIQKKIINQLEISAVDRPNFIRRKLQRLIDMSLIKKEKDEDMRKQPYSFDIDGFFNNYVDYYINNTDKYAYNNLKTWPDDENKLPIYLRTIIRIAFDFECAVKNKIRNRTERDTITFIFDLYAKESEKPTINGLFRFMKDYSTTWSIIHQARIEPLV